MLNERMSKFLFILGIAGWVMSLVLIFKLNTVNEIDDLKEHIQVKTAENAFNIVSQALQDKKTDEEIIKQMEIWFSTGWTAQTGSVTTICDNNRNAFRKIMKDDTIAIVCRLRI